MNEADIIKINCKSTKYFFIKAANGLLGFDAGWPGTYREYKDCIKAKGYKINDIRWIIVSHFHMDHAGLAGMLADKGIQFIVYENQIEKIGEMETLIEKKSMNYHKIDMSKITSMEAHNSRAWLKSIGIAGEVLITNYHSLDSISLLLDDGTAFIGDLPPPDYLMDNDDEGKRNWRLLREKGALYIKPAHAPDYYLS